VGHLHLAAVPRGLGLQLPADLTEVGVRQHTVPVPPDPLRDVRGPPLGGLLDVPPLHTDPLMRVDQAGGELVGRIPAQVRHPRVQSGDAGRGLGAPLRAFLAAGEGTLSRGELVERRLQVARVLELLAGGGDDQGPHPQVNADRATGTLPIRGPVRISRTTSTVSAMLQRPSEPWETVPRTSRATGTRPLPLQAGHFFGVSLPGTWPVALQVGQVVSPLRMRRSSLRVDSWVLTTPTLGSLTWWA